MTNVADDEVEETKKTEEETDVLEATEVKELPVTFKEKDEEPNSCDRRSYIVKLLSNILHPRSHRDCSCVKNLDPRIHGHFPRSKLSARPRLRRNSFVDPDADEFSRTALARQRAHGAGNGSSSRFERGSR
ncbi:hypothetical protein KM043_015263 [Ampulex compressa]|nr:hypothetical protein KM043_015263 [Ampulex compressa]